MESKTIIVILAIIAALVALFFIGRQANLFSLTTVTSEGKIIIDSEIPCNSVQDCREYPEAPSNVYCDTTCKFEDVQAKVVN